MRRRSLWILGIGLQLLAAGSALANDSDGTHYSRWPKVRLAGFAVGAGYTRLGGPGLFGYPYGWGYGPGLYAGSFGGYGPWGWGDPFYGPLPAASFYDASLGKLKLRELDSSASIYLDGGYAGTAGKLKTMWIEPGTHELRITEGDRTFEERIYVLTGKTMTLNPELTSNGGQAR